MQCGPRETRFFSPAKPEFLSVRPRHNENTIVIVRGFGVEVEGIGAIKLQQTE
jgi:hypothetical protein